MEKTIRLTMCPDKSIKIHVNSEEKHTISVQERSISANKIYDIFEFSIGDHYSIVAENESDVDNQVLVFFKELFADIIKKVNAIDANFTPQKSTDSNTSFLGLE